MKCRSLAAFARAVTLFITAARWLFWPSTTRVPLPAFSLNANIAMPPMIICGSSQQDASIPASKLYLPPAANFSRRLDTPLLPGGRIFHFIASPGFVAETMSVYLATGLRAGKAQPEADEIIQKRMLPLSTAVRMVINGTVRDAKTISSILWLDHQITNGRPLRSS